MSRAWWAAALAVLLAAGGVAGAQLSMDVGDNGALNVLVGGTRCLEAFQVLVPAPNWKGGASPEGVTKTTVAPGHTRVTGVFSDGKPCADFTVDAVASAGGLDLAWELRFTRDFDVETVRLNGLLPCATAAGKAAWFVRRPQELRWAIFPARLGEPGGEMSDWSFDWFGWILPGDHGLRFRPQGGLSGMYIQDARQWNGDSFQACWTLCGKGTVRQGTVLRCSLRVEPFTGADLTADAERMGLSLLGVTADLVPAAAGGAQGTIGVRNVRPSAQAVVVDWRVQDDLGTTLAQSKQSLEAPAMGNLEVKVAAPATASGEYRLHTEVRRGASGRPDMADRRLVTTPIGPRATMSLDGTWELIPAATDLDAPPEGQWTSVTVPGSVDGDRSSRYWFRRKFEVPTAMAGKRLKLRFGAANHEARVFVNGRLAGRHFGADLPFELDVTDLAHAGSNDLWVALTNWHAACTKPPATFELGPFEHPASKLPPASIIAPIGADFRLTGLWQSVSLAALPPVNVANVFVRTSVRRHTIQVTATLRNESDQARTLQLVNEVVDRNGPAKQLLVAPVTLAAGESREVTVSADWPNAHLWSLDDPFLYRLVTTLTEGGAPADRLATRFGFREVWTDGPRFVLNGVPMKLFATSGWGMDTWEAAREHLLRVKRAGARSMRLHTQPWQDHILDAADEVGMLIVDEAAVYCYAGAYAIDDRRLWDNYADHVRGLARRDRNHPSLFMYSLENEILLCGGNQAKWEPELGRLADIVREVDPTRLITCEADLDPVGKMDVIGLHYPYEYWDGKTLYPDKCWWMDRDLPYEGRQWRWKRDKPLYIGEFDGGFMAWYPQYQAFWLGNEAYAWGGRFSVDSPNSRARREMIGMEVAAYRQYGVTGMCPWFDADEVDKFGPVAYAPLAVAIRERTHDFYTGEALPRTVYVYNDTFRPAKLKLVWTVAGAGVKAQTGSAAVELQPGASAAQHLTLQAPAVTARTVVKLSLALKEGERTVASEEQELTIFPRVQTAGAQAAPVCLYDPGGKTAAALRALGLNAQPVTDLAALPKEARAVVIGAGALAAGEASWAAQLAEFVAAGGTVVCLEQTAYPSRWLPLEVEFDAKYATVIAFPRASGHPVLRGIGADDLRFWQADHVVARGAPVKPYQGNFVPVVDAGGIRGSINDTNGLNWAPVLELPYGRGRYLLCQLLLVERAGVEPVAAQLLRNLVQYAPGAPPNETASVALLAPPDSSLKRALDGLGLAYDSLLGSLTAQTLRPHQLLIAGGGAAAWEALRGQAAELRAWLAAGGVLWLNNLTPAEAPLLGDLTGPKWEFRSADLAPLHLTKPDPLTSGISSHELYWRERPIWDQFTPLRRIVDFLPTALPPGAAALTDPPGFVKLPVGKGAVLVNQILWDSTEKDRLNGLKFVSILLTNLGGRMDLSAFRPVRTGDFSPVDLSKYCNLSLAGDPGAGWMGHGPQSLAKFPLGEQTLARVPFRILDPATNGGKSLIALRGTARPAYPAEVRGIRVEAPARALHFLHVCAWGGLEGIEAATYVVHYQDGTEQRLPIRTGVEIADWYVDPSPLPYAQVAWQGEIADKPGPIGVYAMRWVNPYPHRPIASIDLVSAGKDPVVAVLAISMEK